MARSLDSTRADGLAARCLAWLPAGYDAPSDLWAGLRQRGVSVREAHDAPSVMAALARRGAKPIHVLIVVEPGALRDADDLVAAVRAYHPTVSVWRYSRAGSPTLDKWDGGATATAGNDRAGGNGHAAEPGPAMRETATTDGGADPYRAAIDASSAGGGEDRMDGGDEDGPPLLTDAELAMLLGGDEEDQCPRRKRDDLDDDG